MKLSPRTIIKIKIGFLVADLIDAAVIVGLMVVLAKLLS